MPAPQNVSLAPFFDLADGMVVRLTALDPTTGAVVAGVVISSVSLAVDPDNGAGVPVVQSNAPLMFLPG